MRGLGSVEWKRKYLLSNNEWNLDVIPEIKNGHNIADYIDPDILERLNQLEKEEDEREQELASNSTMNEEQLDELDDEEVELLEKIREKKGQLILQSRLERGHNHPPVPHKFDPEGDKTIERFESSMRELGIDPTNATERIRSRSVSTSRIGRKRERSQSGGENNIDDENKSRKLSKSRTPVPPHAMGLKDIRQQIKAQSIERKSQKPRNREAKKGEGDRTILNLKPKHLYSGSRGNGTNDRR